MSYLRAVRYLCITTAAFLLLAAVWFALYIFVIAPAGPAYDGGISRAENLRQFFLFQQSVSVHELGFTLAAAIAFLLLAPLGAILRKIFNQVAPMSTLAGAFLGLASSLLVTGQLVQVGTQHAILSASSDGAYDPETLGLMWDTGLMVSNWLENGGYFSLAVGMIGWAIVGRHIAPVHRGWVMLSGVLATTLFIVVVCQALELWAIYDVALSLSGAVLAPAWFLLTARVCGSAADSR